MNVAYEVMYRCKDQSDETLSFTAGSFAEYSEANEKAYDLLSAMKIAGETDREEGKTFLHESIDKVYIVTRFTSRVAPHPTTPRRVVLL